jgi:DNA-binding CsgD family transcriptional regulator/PAS domain-containing protein
VTEAEFGELLDMIYEAALAPDAWPVVMERLADALGGTSGWLSRIGVDDNVADGVITRLDPGMRDVYVDHFADRNPLHNVADPVGYARGWTPRIITDDEWMPKEVLLRSEYYNDFLKPQEVHSTMMIRLALDGFDLSVMNINRSLQQGPFETPQRELAARLHPHLIRAFRLSQRTAQMRLMGDCAAEALDRSPHAMFLVARDGSVKHLNSAAEKLVEGGDAQLVAGRLRVNGESRRLDALMAQALALDPTCRGAGSMAVPRGRGLPLSLSVTPMRADPLSELMHGPSALVSITDLESGMDLPECRLRDLFGLTRAEVAVARALFEGQTTREAAESLGVSFFTVRAHLARICEKTQTRGQVDLARLLMRVGGLAEPAPASVMRH